MARGERSGFTLIEISIVIVIIGLLAAGILIGRDLIRAAQIRAQITQIEKFNQAAGAFRNKYNCIPGDCINALEFGLGVATEPGANGNGNGRVDTIDFMANNRWVGMGEAANFWYHLVKAEMISGDYPGNVSFSPFLRIVVGLHTPELVLPSESLFPEASGDSRSFGKRGGIAILPMDALSPSFPGWGNFKDIFDAPNKNGWFLTSTLAAQTTDSRIGVYYAPTLYALDSKMDDGKPFSGLMRSIPNSILFWDHSVYSTTPPFCYLTDPLGMVNEYNIPQATSEPTDSNAICAPVILTQF